VKRVKVIPISRDMRNLVKQHGSIWISKNPIIPCLANEVIIETTVMVHEGGTQPYSCWVILGVDCTLEEVS